MCKVGILGGTFNPIHLGHIEIAKAAKKQFCLDKIIFLTSGNPPHKQGQDILDGKIRHIMVKRAICEMEGFEACDYEVNRSERSYTLETMKHFKSIFPDDEFYFIIGGDSLRDFDKWYKPDEILKLCRILVYDRTGGTIKSDFADVIIGKKFEISSTEIREIIKNGGDASEFLPNAADEFIKRNEIYKAVPDMEKKLKTMLKPERFIHSLGVRDAAVKLAKIHGADEKKAEIAGLLHDNAKNMPDMWERCADLEVELDETERKNLHLVHAKLGAETAKCIFGITDAEILDAIRWHTVGRPNMSLLEKIIFVADLTEEGRTFPDAKEIRNISYNNIDKAVFECVKSTVEINKKRGNDIHKNAFEIIKSYSETKM